MPLFTKEAQNYTSLKLMFRDIVTDLLAHGFTQKFPISPIGPTDLICTLEAGTTIDSIADTQKWRVRFEVNGTDDMLKVVVATPTQLPDDGTNAMFDDGYTIPGYVGVSGTSLSTSTETPYFDRRCYDAAQKLAYPVSYKLTTTNHGLVLTTWEPGNEIAGDNWSSVVIQRPVSNVDGTPRVTGKCPLHCLYGIKRFARTLPQGQSNSYSVQDRYERFIVREVDVDKPSPAIVADEDTNDGFRVLCSKNMTTVTEDNSYVIMFPNNLSTPRYVYPIDELDLLAYTSSDVIQQNTDASITMYGEAQPRLYRAMVASGSESTGVRFLALHSAPSMA